MKGGSLLFLLSLTMILLLTPRETNAFWSKLMKKVGFKKDALTTLETFAYKSTQSLKKLEKSIFVMTQERRTSICCYEVGKVEDRAALALRSALYTTLVSISRMEEAIRAYRQQLNATCGKCDVPPGEVLCNPKDYQCPSEPEKCIIPSQQCDGTEDCSDGSDENYQNCNQLLALCDPGFACHENELCLPSSYHCDGRRDCPEGSDERRCVSPFPPRLPTTIDCNEDEFKCISEDICVPETRRCDGERDCLDGSDEASCTTTTSSTTTRPTTCGDYKFECLSDGLCVPGHWLCDGEKDCDDGSDEAYCTSTTTTPTTTTTQATTCGDDQFKCSSDGRCVPEHWRCDGDEDCNDGSDETSCTISTTTTTETTNGCGADQLQCLSSGDCLPGWFRCDGRPDCSDGSDEADCETVGADPCEGTPCSHSCFLTPWSADQGFICTCPSGMNLQFPDRHNCVPEEAEGIKGDVSFTKTVKG